MEQGKKKVKRATKRFVKAVKSFLQDLRKNYPEEYEKFIKEVEDYPKIEIIFNYGVRYEDKKQ